MRDGCFLGDYYDAVAFAAGGVPPMSEWVPEVKARAARATTRAY